MRKNPTLADAQEAYLLGQWGEAEEICEVIVQRDGSSGEAFSLLANIYAQTNRLGLSHQTFLDLVRLRPNDAAGYLGIGNVLKAMGRYDDAMDSYNKALALNNEYAECHNNRGALQWALGRTDGALSDFIAAIKLLPDYQDAHQNLAFLLYSLGRFDLALKSFKKLWELEPRKAEAFYGPGLVFLALGDLDKAIASFSDAIKLSGKNPSFYFNRGLALERSGNLSGALKDYECVVRMQPAFPEVYNNKGNVLRAIGQLEAAIDDYNLAIQLAPNLIWAYYGRGLAYTELGLLEMAKLSYEGVLAITPDFPEALNNLGNVLQEMGFLEEAEKCFLRALDVNPKLAEAYFGLHGLKLGDSTCSEAIVLLKKAVEISPLDKDYNLFLGVLLDYAGDHESALNSFGKIDKGDILHWDRLDGWRYIKERAKPLPKITGANLQTFKFCMERACVDGMVLEFGVRHGTSIRQLAWLAGQKIHGFDSFEGLPESWRAESKGSYSTKGIVPEVPDNVKLHVGWFDSTLPAFLRENLGVIRLLNIDCDIYSSTKTILDLIFDRIVPGTVIIFDEYIGNPGWRLDEFAAFQEAVRHYSWGYSYICFSFKTKQVGVIINSVG